MSISLNTHYYDGKLSSTIKELQPLLEVARTHTAQQKATIFAEMWNKLALVASLKKIPQSNVTLARHYFVCITHVRVNDASNHDALNHVYADDVLCACHTFINNEDFCLGLLEQLQEIRNGPCAQGRCTRLIQLLLAYIDT